ncbi:class I SAM-dependent methyltransferase [Streptantibioticus parmotrematis]|nr:methyltransferase domain-containing protein [Streptantibioticus parmotrematis]
MSDRADHVGPAGGHRSTGPRHHGADPASVRAFFAPKAATWDTKFPDDTPAYEAAVAELRLRPGDRVLDAGCGTGRALAACRAAVGADGVVIGADLTPQMLAEAARAGRDRIALLAEADASRLPLRDGVLDAVLAAGLVHHLGDPAQGLREFARVCRPGARLALFHPIGRAALAARRGHTLTPDDVRAEPNLRPLLARTGWTLAAYDDSDERYLALAVRDPG